MTIDATRKGNREGAREKKGSRKGKAGTRKGHGECKKKRKGQKQSKTHTIYNMFLITYLFLYVHSFEI